MRELKWKIDAYTAETMPLDRLAEYLAQLATMLGEPERLHLIRVESGSTKPVLKIDAEAVDHIRQRAHDIRIGIAPQSALQSYRNINAMLRGDKARAALFEGTAEIIQFPGKDEAEGPISGIQQRGSIDGVLQKVGGNRDWVPVQLRTMDETTVTGCYAKKTVAKQLGNHLFEPVRLHGRGRWTRAQTGGWYLDRFWIDTFDTLDDEPLPTVIDALRAIKVKWQKNPIADILGEEKD